MQKQCDCGPGAALIYIIHSAFSEAQCSKCFGLFSFVSSTFAFAWKTSSDIVIESFQAAIQVCVISHWWDTNMWPELDLAAPKDKTSTWVWRWFLYERSQFTIFPGNVRSMWDQHIMQRKTMYAENGLVMSFSWSLKVPVPFERSTVSLSAADCERLTLRVCLMELEESVTDSARSGGVRWHATWDS